MRVSDVYTRLEHIKKQAILIDKSKTDEDVCYALVGELHSPELYKITLTDIQQIACYNTFREGKKAFTNALD